ncbi:PspA/IM30 family protein [Ancylothrix sp. C2]|uniref:PspA/IM30 family protein n=1 Tax=Ancylothrix sp. D3o TaxID=2953691 RepID=UPI0021BA6E2C|nr:PspA/IM30 family protein [Ancylothrix sp. D3o]MCT7948367.1 PspA/IM30 family protein [Ancylothrix sp. D3o]
MGLFDRIVRVIRANFNSLVSAAEDPEKILEQAVMDLQEDLVQLRQAVAGAIASQKRTERQYTQTQSTAEEWYRRAQLALQKGDEHLAREALSRRKTYQETAQALAGQIDQQSVIVNQLKQNMRLLESKIADAKTKKDMYIARARSAIASEKLNELVGQITAGGTVNAFERMEEKVLQLEARSQAIADLGEDTMEKQFASLEASSDVDAQLAELKGQMLKSSQPQKLPPTV